MRERIARHQRDRAERVPGLQTVEDPRDLAARPGRGTAPPHPGGGGLPTLWLTHWPCLGR